MPNSLKLSTSAFIFSMVVAVWGPPPISPAAAQSVPTRLGDLTLENGYPSRQTADRLYDEMDFQRATQAYLWRCRQLASRRFMTRRQRHSAPAMAISCSTAIWPTKPAC